MSTYWYFHCDNCDEWSGVVARDSNGVHLMDGQETGLNGFLEEHQGHALRFGNEYWMDRQRARGRMVYIEPREGLLGEWGD